jgi:acyl-[acyl-carrier-protein] desaturase
MMLAFADMMKKKIVMPAHLLRESGMGVGQLWSHFSDAAQRSKVYTTQDYVDILKSLLDEWEIEKMGSLNDAAEKARDYLVKLPGRLERIAERKTVPELPYQFKWIGA